MAIFLPPASSQTETPVNTSNDTSYRPGAAHVDTAHQHVDETLDSTASPTSVSVPQPLSPMSPFSQQYIVPETPDVHQLGEALVRRPPLAGSVAGEILDAVQNPVNHYIKARNILSDLKKMSELFTDVSCREDSSLDGNSSDEDGFKKPKRKHKRKKSKSTSPSYDYVLKKPNTSSSPL